MDSVRVDWITPADLDEVVRVHCAAFHGSAMTRLGREAVRRYYQWQLSGPHETYAHGAWIGGRLAGFCFGGVHPEAISGFLARNKKFIAWRLMQRPWLLATPLFRDRIGRGLNILRHRRDRQEAKAPAASNGAAPKPPYDILSIAVDPAVQGAGVGRRLMDAAEQDARDNGFRAMTLWVHRTNLQAIGFYERCGWSRAIPAGGDWRGGMEKHLAAERPLPQAL